MTKKNQDKRELLIATAAELVHRQGFHQTTLADIAKAARFPLGNVYYYFKTKEMICDALVDRYLAQFQALCDEWGKIGDARERLGAFIQFIAGNRAIAAQSGCPFGTLCSELHKEGGPLARKATRLLSEPLDWIEQQLRAMGKGKESQALAQHFLTVWQGSLLLAYTFHDPKHVVRETERLREWMDAL